PISCLPKPAASKTCGARCSTDIAASATNSSCRLWPSSSIRCCRAAVPISTSRPSNWTIRCRDRKSTRLNSSHVKMSYADFCLKKKQSKQGCKRGVPTTFSAAHKVAAGEKPEGDSGRTPDSPQNARRELSSGCDESCPLAQGAA